MLDQNSEPQSSGMSVSDKIIEAALAEFFLVPEFSDMEELYGRRTAIRGMMVRLGLYGEFTRRLSAQMDVDPETPADFDDCLSLCETVLDGLPEGPWLYRPAPTDDWGEVRGPDGALIAKAATRASFEEMNAHRRAGTDPAEKIGRFIAEARDLIPKLMIEVTRLSSTREKQDP